MKRNDLVKNRKDHQCQDIKGFNKKKAIVQNQADRHIFESSMSMEDPKVRFDYSMNMLSFRGDWKSNIKVITLFFPRIVGRKKCKEFERKVNKAFESTFLI